MNARFFALCALALTLAGVPAVAQQFPDVPEHHWAYDAIAQLKASGLLVGYPDGTYGGGRPLTRYEFAAATSRAYLNLRDLLRARERGVARLQEQIAQWKPPAGAKGEVTKAELDELKTQLEGLRKQLGDVRAYRADIDALKKLTEEFERDLATLGMDVEEMRGHLRSLEDRVTELEQRKAPITIGGEYHVVGFGGHSRDGRIGVSQSGNLIGSDGSGNPVGLPKDLHLMHEAGLNLSGEFGRARVDAELLASTLVGYEGGGFATLTPGTRREEGATDLFLHRLEASWQDRWFGAPMSVRLGRLGFGSSNYLAFSRIDPDPYIDIERWDNGNWYFDGGILTFGLGDVELAFHAGRSARRGSVQSDSLYQMSVGRLLGAFEFGERPGNVNASVLSVDRHIGVEATYTLPKQSHVAAQYLVLDGEETEFEALQGSPFNRQIVMGADTVLNLTDRLTFYGALADSDLYYNDHSVQTSHNYAYDFSLEYHEGDKWWLGFGYRFVAPLFSAPGSWDRLGYWYNPNDVKGFGGWAHYRLANGAGIWVTGQFLTGTELLSDGSGSRSIGLMNEDDITALAAYLQWPVNHRWSLLLSWEGVFWKFAERPDLEFGGGDVDENYYTAEFSYDMGKDTRFRLGYQVTSYRNKSGSSFLNAPGVGADRADGGLFYSQFSVKF